MRNVLQRAKDHQSCVEAKLNENYDGDGKDIAITL